MKFVRMDIQEDGSVEVKDVHESDRKKMAEDVKKLVEEAKAEDPKEGQRMDNFVEWFTDRLKSRSLPCNDPECERCRYSDARKEAAEFHKQRLRKAEMVAHAKYEGAMAEFERNWEEKHPTRGTGCKNKEEKK
jgi:hypothetical protein